MRVVDAVAFANGCQEVTNAVASATCAPGTLITVHPWSLIPARVDGGTVPFRQFLTRRIVDATSTFGTKVGVVATRVYALITAARCDTRVFRQDVVADLAEDTAHTFSTVPAGQALFAYALMRTVLCIALESGQITDTRSQRDARFTGHAASAYGTHVDVIAACDVLLCFASIKVRAGRRREEFAASVRQTTCLGGRTGRDLRAAKNSRVVTR